MNQNEAPIKIKSRELRMLWKHDEYIRTKCPAVKSVFSDSIYFYNDEVFVSLSTGCKISQMSEKIFIRGINAMCHTNFELEEEE